MASSVELEPAPAITGTRPAAVLDAQLDHPAVLVVAQGRGLPGGADRHQAVHAAGDLALDQARRRRLSSTAPSRNGVTSAVKTPLKEGHGEEVPTRLRKWT